MGVVCGIVERRRKQRIWDVDLVLLLNTFVALGMFLNSLGLGILLCESVMMKNYKFTMLL